VSSKKLDGLRCLVQPFQPQLMTRNGKRIPNRKVWTALTGLIGLAAASKCIFDGELWSPNLSFQEIQSLVMTRDKDIMDPDFGLYIFDMVPESDWITSGKLTYHDRLSHLTRLFDFQVNDTELFKTFHARQLHQVWVYEKEKLQELFLKEIEEGGEGLMVRNPQGRYKHGRATFRENNIFKLKVFSTMEAEIVDVLPLNIMATDAVRECDEFGRPKPVNKKGEREDIDALGSLVVGLEDGSRLQIGSGFDFRGGDKDRSKLWQQRSTLVGKKVEFKYSKVGIKDLPRFPVFLRLREE